LQLINSSGKRGINLSSDESVSFYWEIISGYDTLDELEEYVTGLIDLYFKQIEERTACNKTASNIIKIINKSYGDRGLTIKAISEKLFLSHSYLCVIFKKETGKTINQYINEFRVEKSKELLKDKSIKLYDVATKVGFTDHNYFTKIFKKTTNMTPSEYKEKYVS
jgi:two-component system, response regulator YesN